jgi:DNA processing protein
LAVIGARDSTSYGRRCVTEFVGFAVESGVTIISGGAVGIDAQAHLNAIENSGKTIAYLAGGLDQLYPVENIGLFQAITANGSIFTEQPPGAKPTKWRFLNRNRLIAASAGSTLVVEASWRSGSINTANHALELGRNVGVVPGSIFEPGSQGIFRLAKTPGVQMISQVEDLRTLLGLSGLGQVPLDDLPIGENALRAKDALSSISKTSSEIAIEAGLANFEAEVALSTLQTLGFAQRTAAGWRLSAKSKTNL